MLLQTLVLILSILQVIVASGPQPNAQRPNVTFSNSVRFLFDTDGNQVDAYGSKINCKELPVYALVNR
jgi:hypothetical protein